MYALDVPSFMLSKCNPTEPRLVVGISPMAFCDPRRFWKKDQQAYERYIQKLGNFCAKLAEQKYSLHFFSTELWFNSQAIADLESATREAADPDLPILIQSEPITGIYDLMKRLSLVDVVITCRFHGVVFAHLMNVPVLAIAHHPKVATVMNAFGLSDYCVEINDFDDEMLMAIFQRLLTNAQEIKAAIARNVGLCQKALNYQFNELFPISR